MYESYFGLNGAPFLLNPDPSFYFDSRGHSSALSYLKFGLYQAEGFIVITGDIGAGKTTLVRTLLNDIDHEKVVAAQLVSTQLEAGDLLRSTLTAFGVPVKGQTKAELIASLEAYLTLLATQNKRAVLIVDEAQNLSRDAIEELRMLSNFQFGNQALLQSFLIGQPELRDMLLSRSLEQLRQRVIASYHLGPMDREETRRYIEHRLTKVGWQDDPHFDDDAFDELYQWTSGIPRRINLLCNRLMLATFLAESRIVTATDVARVALEIRAEIGEAIPASAPANAAPPPPPTSPSSELPKPSVSRLPDGQEHVLLIAASRASGIRAAALQRAFASRQGLPELQTLVIDAPGRFELSAEWSEHMGLREPNVSIRLPTGSAIAQMADAIRQLDHLMSEYRPAAVIVQGGDDAALAGSLAAHRQGIPVLHIEAGLRSFDRRRPQEINAMMCDHMADLLLTSEWVAHDNLTKEGISADRVVFVGNMMMDTMREMLPQAAPPKYTLRQFNQSSELLKSGRGFAVVYLHDQGITQNPEALRELVNTLKSVSKDLPLIWPMSELTQASLQSIHALEGVASSQMGVLPIIPYFKMMGLLGTAACVLTDSASVQEEATILGVPCLTLNNYTQRRITVEQGTNLAVGSNSSSIQRAIAEVLRGRGKQGRLPKFWDGLSGKRAVDQFAAWWENRPVPTTAPPA